MINYYNDINMLSINVNERKDNINNSAAKNKEM